MIAAVRPDEWNLPLFLHVFGAMTLVGAVGTVIVLAATAGARPERALLSRLTFWVVLVLVLPSWLLMRIAGQWTAAREKIQDADFTWLGIGYFVGDVGLILLLVTTGLAFWWSRNRGDGWQRGAVLALSGLYLAALALAWIAMSAKFGD